jgi:hypothetical protein
MQPILHLWFSCTGACRGPKPKGNGLSNMWSDGEVGSDKMAQEKPVLSFVSK